MMTALLAARNIIAGRKQYDITIDSAKRSHAQRQTGRPRLTSRPLVNAPPSAPAPAPIAAPTSGDPPVTAAIAAPPPVQAPRMAPFGIREMVVEDPDGHRLAFGEMVR